MQIQGQRAIRFVTAAAFSAASVLFAQTPQTPPPAGQTPPATPGTPPQQAPTFRGGVDSVSVDVTVLDKRGKLVTDLQASDFELRESRQVQKISQFKLIQVDDLAPSNAARDVLSEKDQARELQRDGTRLLVIFLDDYHTRRINGMRMRELLAAFVDSLSPNDFVAVMTPLTQPSALTFSYNHSATARTVAAFEGRKYDYAPHSPLEAQFAMMAPEQIEQIRNSLVITALESTCSFLGAVREGRKQILYVSEGLVSQVPVGLALGSTPAGGGLAQQQQYSMDLQSRMDRVYQAASQANTSISTLDARGLATTEGLAGDPRGTEQEREMLLESTAQLRTMANHTDGRAMVGTNDPSPGLKQMMRDMSGYYLLGYTSPAPHDGKFHEIQVKVNRKDVQVHARKGYWARTEEEAARAAEPAKPAAPRDVTEALASLGGMNAGSSSRRPIQVWMGAAKDPDGKATVTLVWQASSATPPADALDRIDHLILTATSIYGDTLFTGKVGPDAQAPDRPSGAVKFKAPAGSISVHVVVENARGLKLDDQDEGFDVPDFAGGKATITTPIVFRGRTARDIQQLKAAASPMPVITREFSRTERLLLRFQVYGPPNTPVAVTMQLLNQQGDVISAMPSPTTSADHWYESEVGLGPFPPGSYLIEIAAEFGGTKTRSLLAIKVTG